jgi:hypothetical protein
MERRELIELVIRLIDKYDLKNPARFQKYTYPRYYLFAVLKKNAYMPWVEIARLFERNHASVIHGYNMHEIMTETRDLGYKFFTAAIRDEIKIKDEELVRDIAQDVLSLRTFNQLKQLQTKIKMGYYD